MSKHKKFWHHLDPENYVDRKIERVQNRNIEALLATLFVCFKWASFISSVNDLIFQSKPVQWLWHFATKAIAGWLPLFKPLFGEIEYLLSSWARGWRFLLTPIRQLFSLLLLLHIKIPTFLIAVLSNAFVLVALPVSALMVSWITSSKLRAQSKASKALFDAKIEQTTHRREEILSGATRGGEFCALHGVLEEVEVLATLIQKPKIIEAQNRLDWITQSGTKILGDDYTAELIRAQSTLERYEAKKTFRIITDESNWSALEILQRERSKGKIGPSLTNDKFEELLNYMRQTPPPEPFVDPEIVSENLRLHHMHLDAAHYVLEAVRLSGALAFAALILMIVEWIWF